MSNGHDVSMDKPEYCCACKREVDHWESEPDDSCPLDWETFFDVCPHCGAKQ